MASFLDGAFALQRTAAPAAAARAAGEPAATAATGDDVTSTQAARLVATGLLVAGIVLALILKEKDVSFDPDEGFGLLAGFYVVAQAIERLLELLPGGLGSKQSKANRAVVFPALGFIIAVIAAEVLGLYFLDAIGRNDVSKNLDVIVTALAIGGGTKPLHDLIKRIEKAKETPPATT